MKASDREVKTSKVNNFLVVSMKFVSVRSTVYGIGPTMMLERSSSAADAGGADPDSVCIGTPTSTPT